MSDKGCASRPYAEAGSMALRAFALAIGLTATALCRPSLAETVAIGVFETEIGCERIRSLGSEACRRAFANAQAEFVSKTKSYANRAACYRSFGPCMPWPLHTPVPTHFRPQLMGVAVTRSGSEIVSAPVVAPGKVKIAFVSRPLSSEPAVPAASASTDMALNDVHGVANLRTVCAAIEAAATREKLPAAFLTRLLWQESSFRSEVVSPAGAQGIAQFMPGTAEDRGLDDPFDPEKAISTSASLLSDLTRRFGNLGLAAAAYNGGPARVSGWLRGDRTLANETRDYVLRITSHSVDDWAAGLKGQGERLTFPTISCR